MFLHKIFNSLFAFFTVFSTSLPALTPLKAASNSLDSELYKMGIIEESHYAVDENSSEEISTLLFLENDNDYSIYLYYPLGMENIQVNTLQLGYCASSNTDYLNYDSNLIIADYQLSLVGLTDNKTVAKYSLLDTPDGIFNFPYRRYSIRQINYSETLEPSSESIWKTLGDEYMYYYLNGKTAYQYKKTTFIKLNNILCAAYYFPNNHGLGSLYGDTGKENYFYGFSTDFKIDNLTEVQLLYDYCPVVGYCANLYSPYYNPLLTFGEYQSADILVLQGQNKVEVDDGLFYNSGVVRWDRISTYDDLASNKEVTFANFISKNFINCDFIINFASFSYETTEMLYSKDSPYKDELEYFEQYAKDYDDNYYEIIHFIGTYLDNINVVRMKYETDGIVYDIQVITDPVKTESFGTGIDDRFFLKDFFKAFLNSLSDIGTVILIVLLVVLFVLLAPLLIPLIKVVGKIIVWPFKKIYELFTRK